MRESRYIPGDKDVIGDNGIDIEDTAPGVTADAKRAYGEAGVAQPFRIAHRPLGHHRHLGVDAAAIRELGAAHPPLCIALQGGDGHLTAQIHPVLALQGGNTPGNRSPRAPTSGAAPRSTTVTGDRKSTRLNSS